MILVERARVSGMCARCLGHGRRAVHTAQLPRSILFEPPYVEDGPGPQTQSFRSRHRAQLREAQKASQSSSEKAAKTEALRDPWGAMANSPKRRCIVSKQDIPSDFLINLRPAWQPAKQSSGDDGQVSQDRLFLLPDRVQHPRRSTPKRGKGRWVSCHRDVITQLGTPGPHTGLLRTIPGLRPPEQLAEMAHSQLQMRILEEMELLEARLRSLPRDLRPLADLLKPLAADALDRTSLEAGTIAVLSLRRSASDAGAINREGDWPSQPRQDDEVEIPIYPSGVFSDHNALRRIIAKLLRADEDQLPAFAEISSAGRYGHLSVPVAIALLRLRLFHGWGWDPSPSAQPSTTQDVVQ